MHRKYFFWILIAAIASVGLVAFNMWKDANKPQYLPNAQIAQGPKAPFHSYISGVGIVEPSSQNIYIGSPINRLVDEIDVKVGQKVKAGDILFRLDSRDLEADLNTRIVSYEDAVAKLKRLEALPRKEDVEAAEAVLKNAKIDLEQAKTQFDRVQGLQEGKAMSSEEINRRRFNFEKAEAKVQQTLADLEKTKAGAWKPDLEIAKLQVEQAKAAVDKVKTDIERTVIHAPLDATVLQIKIHEGEYPPNDPSRNPPMILGNTDSLHVRVNINQFDAFYFKPSSPAVAFLQGNAQVEFPLKFVQLEPYFVTKQYLTNDINEKVDTRVLQVIYCFREGEQRIYIGQQMDVFIETEKTDKE